MSIHLKITNKIVLQKARDELAHVESLTLRELCPQSRAVHFENGYPAGLLFDANAATLDLDLTGLRFLRSGIYFFGQLCDLYEPDKRTLVGRSYAKVIDAMRAQVQFNRELFELIAPAIRGEIVLEQFGFDYINQTTVQVTPSALYVHILGVSTKTNVFRTDFGIEIISREEYRAAVKSGLIGTGSLLFSENDPLVKSACDALSIFVPLDVKTVNALMSDIYMRVVTEPEDVAHYIKHLLLPSELMFIFATIAAILHAFYGNE